MAALPGYKLQEHNGIQIMSGYLAAFAPEVCPVMGLWDTACASAGVAPACPCCTGVTLHVSS
jgi:hypothetical protein